MTLFRTAGVLMTDQELWRLGVSQIEEQFEALAEDDQGAIRSGAGKLMSVKAAMHALVDTINGAVICADCGGLCCVSGKYHFSAVDLIVYYVTGTELFIPDFAGKGCIYLQGERCLMSPQLRPFNCITFVCEQLEVRLPPGQKELFYALERELRNLYQDLLHIFPDPRMHRSVMSFAEKNVPISDSAQEAGNGSNK